MTRFILGVMWCAGLLLAGSDNPWMPWTNLGGLAMFAFASIGIGAKFSKRIRDYRKRDYIYYNHFK